MSQETKVVVFHTGQEKYAVNIARVERIIGYSATTPLPETSDYVLGLIQYQEGILPVVDLNKRFYKNATVHNEDSKILVIQLKDYKLGLLVDAVTEIKSIYEEMIENPPGAVKGISPNYIKGLIKKDENIIVYLEIGEVFQGEGQKELMGIMQNS